jgi:hypothetical protein
MSDEAPTRRLREGQRCRIRVWQRATGDLLTVHESTTRLYEAPNWTADGRLVVNGDGLLWTLPVDGSVGPEAIDAHGLPSVKRPRPFP